MYIEAYAPEIARAIKGTFPEMRAHFVFLFYRVLVFTPVILALMPHDHAVFLVDAAIIETSGIVITWGRQVRTYIAGGNAS